MSSVELERSFERSSIFGRTPPASEEAEIAVLCAMMIDAGALAEALELVDDLSFYWERNRRVFRAARVLFDRGDTVDVVSVIERLRESGELEAVGGIDYVSALVGAVPTSAHIGAHAKIVREKAALRRIVEISSSAIRDVYDLGEKTAADIASATEDRLLALGSAGTTEPVRAKERLWNVFEDLERRQSSDEGVAGIRTGLADLDAKILGLRPGELTIIGARPSMGKSALAMGLALEASIGQTIPTAVFSFEMTTEDLLIRGLASEARLDLHWLRAGKPLSQEDHERLAGALGHLNAAPLWIDDSADDHLADVSAKVRRLRHTENVGLVVIDYLQLMSGPSIDRIGEIDAITRGLKKLAKSLSIHVVLLSQLSRKPEGRTNKRPLLSDLRESGGIEQDADLVLLLYRPEYYLSAAELESEKNRKLRGLAEIIIAKQRNGPVGTVRARWDGKSTRFDNLARAGGPQPPEQGEF